MPMWLKILSDVLIACGAFFALVGVLGILRMPDTFCRMQASTCVSTLGVIGVALGGLLALLQGLGAGGQQRAEQQQAQEAAPLLVSHLVFIDGSHRVDGVFFCCWVVILVSVCKISGFFPTRRYPK